MIGSLVSLFVFVGAASAAAVHVKDIRGDFLDFHNQARAQHEDTEALKWNEELEDGASAYAQHLVDTGKFEHSAQDSRTLGVTGVQGENLFQGSSVTFQTQSVNLCNTLWYEEGARFDFKMAFVYNFKGITGLGHFTAMVWQPTKLVGCAGAYTDTATGRRTVYVCRYSPQGNVPGKYTKYVKPLKSEKNFPAPGVKAFFAASCADSPALADYCTNTVANKLEYCETYKSYLAKGCAKTCGNC